MIDRWIRRDEPEKPLPAQLVLRPGDPDWRQRWLAAVRRRMQASLRQQPRLHKARMAALAADPTLWSEIRAAELAYTRGEGEFFVPGQGPRDGTSK